MTMTQVRPKPASEKQQALVARLMTEKALTGTAYEGWVPDWSKATTKSASAVISYLLTLPAAEVDENQAEYDLAAFESAAHAPVSPAKREFGAAWGSIPVGGKGFGYFALEVGPEQHKFFRVERPTEGKWAGKTFIKEQAGDAFYPIEPKARGYSYLTEIARDHEEAGRLYAFLLRKCYRCNRTLTLAESRERGLGSDCAQKV